MAKRPANPPMAKAEAEKEPLVPPALREGYLKRLRPLGESVAQVAHKLRKNPFTISVEWFHTGQSGVKHGSKLDPTEKVYISPNGSSKHFMAWVVAPLGGIFPYLTQEQWTDVIKQGTAYTAGGLNNPRQIEMAKNSGLIACAGPYAAGMQRIDEDGTAYVGVPIIVLADCSDLERQHMVMSFALEWAGFWFKNMCVQSIFKGPGWEKKKYAFTATFGLSIKKIDIDGVNALACEIARTTKASPYLFQPAIATHDWPALGSFNE